MKIGELAQAAGSTVETVRYYEREGLLPVPNRGENNYRKYGLAHLERLRFIRNCRALDMSHDEIRSLLQLMDAPAGCQPIGALFDSHIEHVDIRIAELSRLREQLVTLRHQCGDRAGAADDCGIVHGLADMPAPPVRPVRHSHLG